MGSPRPWIGLVFAGWAAAGCGPREATRAPAPTQVAAPTSPEPTVAVQCVRGQGPGKADAAIACAEMALSANDVDAALEFLDVPVRRKYHREIRVGYTYAELAAQLGRAGFAARALATAAEDDSLRVLGEGVLALHEFQRTGETQYLDAVRRGYQVLLARRVDDPYAIGLALRHFLALAPSDPRALGVAAQTCTERMRGLLGLDPSETEGVAEVVARCAEVALLSEDPRGARELFARALQLDARRHETRLRWARMELAAGNLREAARLFAEATRAPNPLERIDAYMGLGVARGRMLDRGGAEEAYRAVVATYDAVAFAVGNDPRLLPREIVFNLGVLLAGSAEAKGRDEGRRLLEDYVRRADADEAQKIRAAQVLFEIDPNAR